MKNSELVQRSIDNMIRGFSSMVNQSYDPIVSNMPEWKCTVVEPDYTKLNDCCSSCGAKDYKRIATHEYECTFCGGKTYI